MNSLTKKFALVSGLWLLASSWSFSAEPLPLSTAYWKDEAFLKSFNGSYRIEARIEPNVSTEERGLLVEIQNLMADDKRAAALEKLKSSALTKTSPALTFNLANLYFETGDIKNAITSYEAARKDYPSFRRAHRNLALAYVRENDLEKALTHLTEAIKLGDAEGSTYGLLGYCRLSREEFASALQAYRLAQVTEPDVAEWKAGIAQCLQHLDEKSEAIALLEEVIRQRPLESSYSILKANIHLELDELDDAVKALELPFRLKLLSADPTMLLADLHLRANRKSSAQTAIDAAFSNKENQPSTSAILRVIHTASSQEDWKLVKTLFEKTSSEKPDRALSIAKARYLIASNDDVAAGVALLRKLTEEDPTDGQALLTLAKHLADTKQPESAELMFERASADTTTAYEAFVELARLHVSQTRYAEALTAIDKALALNPTENLRTYRQTLQKTLAAAE
jgi:tetratricopeptide (TPR) repeat protein